MEIYYTVISVACYMFRPPIVAIFKEVFFEGYIYIHYLPEVGQNIWPKHVAGYVVYNTINSRMSMCIWWSFHIINHKRMVTNHLKLTTFHLNLFPNFRRYRRTDFNDLRVTSNPAQQLILLCISCKNSR